MTQRLFVYGTLRRDSRHSMFHLLARHAEFEGRARIRGRLYDLGEYPGVLITTDRSRWVHGDVYTLKNADEALARLDEYEGCGPGDPKPHEFEPVMDDAVLEDGRIKRVWVYVYRGALDGKQEIPSGDYFERTL